MSIDTLMEDSDYSSVSDTNAIIYGASDTSGRTISLISDPNIPNSSSTSEDEYQQQQISTAVVDGGTDDLMSVSSNASSSWFKDDNKQSDQQDTWIFNVDFRASSSLSSRNRPHECAICGLEFLTGQALGGHMRRHRPIIIMNENVQVTPQLVRQSNIPNSSSTSEDEYQQQQISTAAVGGGTDDLISASSNAFSSWFKDDNKQSDQQDTWIFNVDFRASSSLSSRNRPHECAICGLEFLTGQALGGHMRRHRPIIIMNENVQVIPQLVRQSNDPRVSYYDLNLTPMENDLRFTQRRRILQLI